MWGRVIAGVLLSLTGAVWILQGTDVLHGSGMSGQRQGRARIRERRLDLRSVADDAGVAEEALHVGVAEAGHRRRVEIRERGAEGVALAEDRPPREARLERLEAHSLEEPSLVEHGE